MPVNSAVFFQHVDPFTDYRKTIYDISDETIRSNIIDLRLFEEFIKERNIDSITGPAVMAFQYYLKNDRQNTQRE